MRLPRQNLQRPFFPAQFPFVTALLLLTLLSSGTALNAAQVTSNPPILHFGSILIGQSETLPATLTNPEPVSVSISAVSSTSTEFSVQGLKLPLVIPSGQTVTVNVTFAPTANGWSGGDIAFTSSVGTIYLRMGGVGVTGASLTSSTSSLGFGSIAVGSTSMLPVVLTNSGSSGLAIAQALLTGAGFSITGPTLPLVLQPSQSITFNVTFAPQSSTSFSGSLYVPNGALTIPMSGTGTTSSQLVLTPTALNFGNTDVGTTSTQPVTLTANSGAVTVSSSASSSSQFLLEGATFPFTIASGQSVTFNVAFTPSANGKVSGNLSLASNASDSNAQEGLSGVGITAQSSVTVSWSASASQVVGYNVYRGASETGTYSKVNSALNPTLTYTDSTVSSGQTYYYVATSVNSNGEESSYSTSVEASIP